MLPAAWLLYEVYILSPAIPLGGGSRQNFVPEHTNHAAVRITLEVVRCNISQGVEVMTGREAEQRMICEGIIPCVFQVANGCGTFSKKTPKKTPRPLHWATIDRWRSDWPTNHNALSGRPKAAKIERIAWRNTKLARMYALS